MFEWDTFSGFQYVNGSLFDRLAEKSIPVRFYNDYDADDLSLYSDDPSSGSVLGAVPQATAIDGVSSDFVSLQQFASDLQGPYPFPYTFVEPHYGDVTGGSYAGGSSQHPMDDVYGGKKLLSAVASTIMASPYWDSSLIVVLYDEHGGFYDWVAPPPAVAPGDGANFGYNRFGFDFTTLGVRVPAVLVSPLIPAGTVDGTVYDHSSVPRMLEDLWGLRYLTNRDKNASSPLDCLSLATPRTDHVVLPPPAPAARNTPSNAALRAEKLSRPVTGRASMLLALLRKADRDMSDGTVQALKAIDERMAEMLTRGDVERYGKELLSRSRKV